MMDLSKFKIAMMAVSQMVRLFPVLLVYTVDLSG